MMTFQVRVNYFAESLLNMVYDGWTILEQYWKNILQIMNIDGWFEIFQFTSHRDPVPPPKDQK